MRSDKGSALIWAAGRGDSEFTGALIDAGADVNVKDRQGQTPLMLAAYSGNAQCVRKLIAGRADVSARDADGRTALMHVAGLDSEQIVAALKEAGAKQ